MRLAEKEILPASQAAQLLEKIMDIGRKLPIGDRSWLTEFVNALWMFEKVFGQHIIH